MRLFLVNLLLALIWAALTTDFKVHNILLGFFLAFLIIAMTSRIWSTQNQSYAANTWIIIKFLSFLLSEMVLSSLRVAIDVLKPRLTMKPGVIALPLNVKSDLELTLLANIISFSPGTLTLDISSDSKTLFFHTMYAEDVVKQRADIKTHIEDKIVGLFE